MSSHKSFYILHPQFVLVTTDFGLDKAVFYNRNKFLAFYQYVDQNSWGRPTSKEYTYNIGMLG